MKNLLLLTLLAFTYSCKNSEEVYLYDKNDPQYQALKQEALDECKAKSKSLQALKSTYEFDNYKVNDIFEYVYKEGESSTHYIHLVITAITANDMTLNFYSRETNVDFDSTPKSITFTEANALDIYNTLATGVCSVDDTMIGASSLNATNALNYRFNAAGYKYYKDIEFKTYEQRSGSYFAEISVPTLALLFNRTISDKTKLVANDSNINSKDFTKTSLTNIGSNTNECKADCTVVTTQACTVVVDTNYYKPGTKTGGTNGYSGAKIKSLLKLNCI